MKVGINRKKNRMKKATLDILTIFAVVVGGGIALAGFLGLIAACVIVPALIVTWAWNFMIPGLWTEAPILIWWQTLLIIMAISIVSGRLRGPNAVEAIDKAIKDHRRRNESS